MASSPPQSVTSEEPPKNSNEQITFRFCNECANMLYPKEDEDAKTLMYTCRTCMYTTPATSSCVFRNVLNNSAGETAGVTQDVGSDPTVGGPLSLVSSETPHSHTPSTLASTSGPPASTVPGGNDPAVCLRCGITLLHCNRCGDPASIPEYNNKVLQTPDFMVDRSMRYIKASNHWKCLDFETQSAYVEGFASCHGPNFGPYREESINDYLNVDYGRSMDEDPIETYEDPDSRLSRAYGI